MTQKMAVINCSVGNHLGDNLWLPFSETANYFGMEYLGNAHVIAGKDNRKQIAKFINLVETEKSCNID